MSALQNLASGIRRLRERAKLTQAEAAAKCRLTSQRWSDYERGVRSPTIQVLDRILDGLDLSVFDLARALEWSEDSLDTQAMVEFSEMLRDFLRTRGGGREGNTPAKVKKGDEQKHG